MGDELDKVIRLDDPNVIMEVVSSKEQTAAFHMDTPTN
jgi:hypothetical protein